jgi:hypothetical protein
LREESLLVLCFDPRGILRFAQNDKPRDFFRSLFSLCYGNTAQCQNSG